MLMDLNADLGEGGENDEALMPLIQRANIACGGHAGDIESVRATIRLAKRYNVSIGGHPSYPDRDRFGRVETGASSKEIYRFCCEQLRLLVQVAENEKVAISHVKAHGALYHRVMTDALAAVAFLQAVESSVGPCAIMGLPNTPLEKLTREKGWIYLAEMFADRRYEPDGSLTPRSDSQALIADENEAVAQVLSVRDEGRIKTRTGQNIALHANTVCVHGDGEHAVQLAQRLHSALGL